MATLTQTLGMLDSVLQALVCGDARLHARLVEVVPQLSQLREKDIPPDFRKDFKEVMGMMGRFRPEIDQAELEHELALSIYQVNKRLIGETGVIIGFPKRY